MLSPVLQIVLAFGCVRSFRQRAVRHLRWDAFGEGFASQSQHQQQKQQKKTTTKKKAQVVGLSFRSSRQTVSGTSVTSSTSLQPVATRIFSGKCEWKCVEKCGDKGTGKAVVFREKTFTIKDGQQNTADFTSLAPILEADAAPGDTKCVRFGEKEVMNSEGAGTGKLYHEVSSGADSASTVDHILSRIVSAGDSAVDGLILAGEVKEASGGAGGEKPTLTEPIVELDFIEPASSKKFRVRSTHPTADEQKYYLQVGQGLVTEVGANAEKQFTVAKGAVDGETNYNLYFKNVDNVAAAVFEYTCGDDNGC